MLYLLLLLVCHTLCAMEQEVTNHVSISIAPEQPPQRRPYPIHIPRSSLWLNLTSPRTSAYQQSVTQISLQENQILTTPWYYNQRVIQTLATAALLISFILFLIARGQYLDENHIELKSLFKRYD